jgi:hypothetical protein
MGTFLLNYKQSSEAKYEKTLIKKRNEYGEIYYHRICLILPGWHGRFRLCEGCGLQSGFPGMAI